MGVGFVNIRELLRGRTALPKDWTLPPKSTKKQWFHSEGGVQKHT